MGLDLLPNVLAGAVVLTGLYILIGLSWIVVFRGAHLFNFATGELFVFGGYLVTALIATGIGYWLSTALGVLIMAVLGAALYRFLLRPFAGQPLFTPVIVTLGFAIVLHGFMDIFFGRGNRQIAAPFPNEVHQLPFGIRLTTADIVLIAVSLLVYIGLLALVSRTRLGRQMRAAHESPLLASQSGINIFVIFGVAFGISVAILAVAGVANGQRTLVAASAIPLGLKGLVPAMVGGLDSIGGILPGALLVAVAESLTILYLGGNYSDAVVFSILLIVLAVRPYGLFGSPTVERV